MNKEELLNQFLGAYPESSHPCDRKRFLKYAMACIAESTYIDEEAMRAKILDEQKLNEYKNAFSWIRETVEELNKN